MHRHLRRLDRVWIDWPISFITTCTFKRRPILASNEPTRILTDEWQNARDRQGWAVGRYVIMPNSVHFFCSAEPDAKALPRFIHAWKQWTTKRIGGELKFAAPIWQEEFLSRIAIKREL
jgi:REP element-mobilizing transposase RayT